MSEEKKSYSEEEIHSAMGTVAGFTFQFYYFLYRLLTAENGSSISFELYDDVAAENPNGITLFQVKHTINAVLSKKMNTGCNLTNRAAEMWKALNVWQRIILNKNEKTGHSRKENEQKSFIDNHQFVFVCNKDLESNDLISLCTKLASGESLTLDDIDKTLEKISEQQKKLTTKPDGSETKHKTVQRMIDELRKFPYRKEFLSKIEFKRMMFDDMEEKCKEHINKVMRFSSEQAKYVLENFLIEVVKDLVENSKTGKPLCYTYEEQQKRFECVFAHAKATPLEFPLKKHSFQPNFMDLVCVKQLVKVNDIDLLKVRKGDIDKVVRYVSQFYSFKNRYEDYKEDCLISEVEDQSFREDALTVWSNNFDYYYDDLPEKASETEIASKAKDILHAVRGHNLKLTQPLGISISNGAFYYLSDEGMIGWHRDWEKFFKK